MIEGFWSIWEIRNSNDNHLSAITISHLSFCKIYFITTIILKINKVIQVNLKSLAIVDSLRVVQGSYFDNNQPIYKTKDIYNMKADF